MLLVRCRTVDRTRAPSGENGRKTNLNRHSRASCACLACCWSPLACTQCVVSPRAAVIRGRYMFSEKSTENKGSNTKGKGGDGNFFPHVASRDLRSDSVQRWTAQRSSDRTRTLTVATAHIVATPLSRSESDRSKRSSVSVSLVWIGGGSRHSGGARHGPPGP